MNEEKNGQTPNDEPSPATPDILEKGEDAEEKEPKSATQDIMRFRGKPSKAKQDIIFKMLTPADLEEEFIKEVKKKLKEEKNNKK